MAERRGEKPPRVSGRAIACRDGERRTWRALDLLRAAGTPGVRVRVDRSAPEETPAPVRRAAG